MDNDFPQELIRVQKFLAEAGVDSRRGCDALVAEGRVTVNDEVAVPGTRVAPERDRVTVDGHRIQNKIMRSAKRLVLMMNKPKGVLCTHGDPHGGRTIYELLPSIWQEQRLLCAGRLDKDSEGMVILTNDGDLVQQISHPSGGVIKRYRVQVHRPFNSELIPRLLRGVTREGERLYAHKVIPCPGGPESATRLEIHLQQGRKREIRRLLEAFGYFVKKLRRVQMGALELKHLAPGRARELKPYEVKRLFQQ